MARKKGGRALEEHIAELEAIVGEIATCPACGKTIDPDVSTCPYCGSAVNEVAELNAQAAESLEDLGKHLDETLEGEPPEPPPPEPDPSEGLASAAAVADEIDDPEVVESAPHVAPAAQVFSPEPEFAPEPEPRDLEGFIASIEAEVGVEAPRPARAAASKPAVRTVRRSAPAPPARSSRWAAAVAGGGVLYLLSLLLMTLLDRAVVASFMVVGTFLVVAGIGVKPGPPGASRGTPRTAPSSEYVCPLCGSEIPSNASECSTCGAVFAT